MKIAFYKGRKRIFNRFVSGWTRGPYSHTEAVFDSFPGLDGQVLCGSSSFKDGGVRLKLIELVPEHWDIIDVPAIDGLRVLDWFHEHLGDPYDLVGLLATSFPVLHGQRKWFCNEAIGTAAGLAEAWRQNPNGFARICELMGGRWICGGPQANPEQQTRPVSAGHLFL